MQASSSGNGRGQHAMDDSGDPLQNSETSTDSFLDGAPLRGGAAAATASSTSSTSAPAPPPQPPAQPHGHGAAGSGSMVLCVECEDQSAEVTCMDCEEDFCRPCFASQHRRGKRSEHRVQALLGEMMAAPEVPESTAEGKLVIVQQAEGGAAAMPGAGDAGAGAGADETAMAIDGYDDDEEEEDDGGATPMRTGEEEGGDAAATAAATASVPNAEDEAEYSRLRANAEESFDERHQRMFLERCRTIPLRLTPRERKLLAVLESALNVSEYTDKVDTMSRKPKQDRILGELEHLFATILGLMICSEPKAGAELVRRSVQENEAFFREIFEVGRRYKIMNPDRMRGTYGKLMYMLQDTQNRFIQPQIGFCCVKEVLTVTTFLESRDALALLSDARVLIATRDITDKGGRRSREEVAGDVARKQRAARELKARFADPASGYNLTADDVQRVLDSIADANNYLNFNAGPVRRMIRLLHDFFDAEEIESGFSLAIGGGGSYRYKSRSSSSYYYGGGYGSSYFKGSGSGAKLSHDHATQFTYVYQSLRLWREIMRRMFRLWHEADADLLSTQCSYQLLNTGQGLNRVQSCPRVGAEMRSILSVVQRECGAWVGLSVVHLGDRDVPNALMFIDKYTQVPRILAPIARVVDQLGELFENPALRSYAEEVWDHPDNLRMHVLVDFFKHAFDGDGDDGGSCIDGRLTSAWNWCSKLGKKPYMYAFMLASFQGFDGDFKN